MKKMVHEYIAIPVDTETYDNTKIGEDFAGLAVVDGLYDSDNDQLILVLRVNNPSEKG